MILSLGIVTTANVSSKLVPSSSNNPTAALLPMGCAEFQSAQHDLVHTSVLEGRIVLNPFTQAPSIGTY